MYSFWFYLSSICDNILILVNSGVPLYNVKELLGHKDITVTQRYSHLADASLRAATATASDTIRSAIQ